jgi:hypothetical protein
MLATARFAIVRTLQVARLQCSQPLLGIFTEREQIVTYSKEYKIDEGALFQQRGEQDDNILCNLPVKTC